jgi:hypothetical protein
VDSLPSRPKFQWKEIMVGDEVLDLYHRDILECVHTLYGNPDFAPHLIFKPERRYEDADQLNRMYNDMHTGKWWWETQVCNSYNHFFGFPNSESIIESS